jgi:hypothetical protein
VAEGSAESDWGGDSEDGDSEDEGFPRLRRQRGQCSRSEVTAERPSGTKGVAPGVSTRMAWGPQLRAAVARSSPLCWCTADTEAGRPGPQRRPAPACGALARIASRCRASHSHPSQHARASRLRASPRRRPPADCPPADCPPADRQVGQLNGRCHHGVGDNDRHHLVQMNHKRYLIGVSWGQQSDS